MGGVNGANIVSAEKSIVAANNALANSTSGHGIMAEEAQTVIDKLWGRDALVVGRTNIKDGADRLVDGTYIQTKFYNSGKRCVDACFDKESGLYRYFDDKGNPMPVEVPKDMYDDAVSEFAKKISKGKVPGVTDSDAASDYVRSSDLTYENAVNLCSPLTKESLLYDCATGVVHCSFVFGISGAAAFIIEYKRSKSVKRALLAAIKTGVKVFGLSYVLYILCSQFARTKLYWSLPNLFTGMGKESSGAEMVRAVNNSIKIGSGDVAASASASLNQLSRFVKSSLLISLIVLLVFMVPEIYRFARGKITSGEFLHNIVLIVASKLASTLLFILTGAILATFVQSSAVAMVLCLIASCAGGYLGRKLIFVLELKSEVE